MKTPTWALLSAAVLLLPGCLFLENRGDDFLDAFTCTLKAGAGANANLKIGPLTYGIGYWEGYEAGLHGEDGFTVTLNKVYSCPFPLNVPLGIPLLWALVKTDRYPYPELKWLGFLFTKFKEVRFVLDGEKRPIFKKSIYHYEIEYAARRPLPVTGDPPTFLWKRIFAVEVDLSLFLGLRLGFNAAELLDFVLGWFGVDLLADDRAPDEPADAAKGGGRR